MSKDEFEYIFESMQQSAFRTCLEAKTAHSSWNIRDSIVTIGSCFSDVIGGKLKENKFKTSINPFGTVFNPISIFRLLLGEGPSGSGYVSNQEIYWHFDYHSKTHATEKNELNRLLTNLHQTFNESLTNASHLVITFGTAWVYKLKSSGDIVSNCHKSDQSLFARELLRPEAIINGFNLAYKHIKQINPDVSILLTLSPVRHTKDGMENNAVSKSILRLCCHDISMSYDDVEYFPSYELMMDDLRDYRFYGKDMIHPNEVAEDYIWEHFQETYFDQETKDFIKDWEKIRSALNHKPFNVTSAAHQKFLRSTLDKLKSLSSLVDTSTEEHFLAEQLT